MFYYIGDHLGVSQIVVDSSAQVVWQADFDPFGQANISVNLLDNIYRFPGQIDSKAGLQYNWHRFYEPSAGRYISADPIGLNGGNKLYAYANLNPTIFLIPMILHHVEEMAGTTLYQINHFLGITGVVKANMASLQLKS